MDDDTKLPLKLKCVILSPVPAALQNVGLSIAICDWNKVSYRVDFLSAFK